VVKRQTVWLSTMMVLSLMLIGYYTMNNPTSPTSAPGSNPSGTVVTGTDTTPGSTTSGAGGVAGSGTTTSGSTTTPNASQTSSSSSGSSSAAGSATGMGTTAGSTSADDFFVQTQTQVDSQMSKQLSSLQDVIANNNASSATISQAEQQLQVLTNTQGNMLEAKDAVIGDGYQDCVIVPTSGAKLLVYVKATKFGATDAVNVLNIVSQQMNVPMTNIIVKQHS